MFVRLWNDIVSPYSSLTSSVLASVVLLLLFIAAILLSFLMYDLLNTLGIKKVGMTTVMITGMDKGAAYTSHVFIGNVLVPLYNPESHWVHFQIDGQDVSTPVEEEFFKDVQVGETIEVDYGTARFSRTLTPIELRTIT